jgi:hypothetical protein
MIHGFCLAGRASLEWSVCLPFPEPSAPPDHRRGAVVRKGAARGEASLAGGLVASDRVTTQMERQNANPFSGDSRTCSQRLICSLSWRAPYTDHPKTARVVSDLRRGSYRDPRPPPRPAKNRCAAGGLRDRRSRLYLALRPVSDPQRFRSEVYGSSSTIFPVVRQVQFLRVSRIRGFLLKVENTSRILRIYHDARMTLRPKPIDDDWWTLAMVGSYLKLSKRALWDIRRNIQKGFPEPIRPGGKVCLFLADEIRAWAISQRGEATVRGALQTPATVDARGDAAQTDPDPPLVPMQALKRRPRERGRCVPLCDDRQLELF